MNGNWVYSIGIGLLVVGTILTYWGSHLKSEMGTKELKTAISKKDTLIDNLSVHVTELRKDQEKSLLIQEAPVVKILPEGDIKGAKGNFELSIENSGLSDVGPIEIYEDYFVALGQKNFPVILYRFGIVSTKPNTIVESLLKGENKKFRMNFITTYNDMQKFYLDENNQGQRMMVARIKLSVTRKIDGKKFGDAKAFIIAGHGDYLIDYDTSRDITGPGLAYSYDDVKKILGTTQ